MAELKRIEEELPKAEFASYGIPPKQPDAPKLVKGQEAEALDRAAAVSEPSRSFVCTSTYNVPVFRSITGVEVMPTSGLMNGQSTSRAGTGGTPASGCMKLTFPAVRKSVHRYRTRKCCCARGRRRQCRAGPCRGPPLPTDREAARKWARLPETRTPCQTALR